MDKGILRDYLRLHSSDVVNMLFNEFKLEDARAVLEEEAEARGMKKGMKMLPLFWKREFHWQMRSKGRVFMETMPRAELF